MTGVLIAARKTDKKMWKTLPSILCESFSARLYTPQDSIVPQPAELLIGDYAQAAQMPVTRAVAVFRNVLNRHCLPHEMEVIAVVDSEMGDHLHHFVSEEHLPAITCGLSARDTLSLSSITADSAVVALQRSLPCFDGTVVEPQEIPVQLTDPIDSFTLMSIAAISLVTGQTDRLKRAIFHA